MSLLNIILILVFIALSGIILLKQDEKKSQLQVSRKDSVNGIIFGTRFGCKIYSSAENEGHVCVFGGSGLGKTSAILVPTLRAWQGSSFTVDISGDISANANCKNKLVYDPSSEYTIPYNIFSSVDKLTSIEQQNESLERLALLIMPDLQNSDSEAANFYNREGRKILTAALIAFYHQGLDFVEICEMIVSHSYRDLFRKIDETENAKAIMFINSFEGSNEQNTSGCKQSCDAAIKLFATNDRLKKNLRRPLAGESCFTIDKILGNNVYVIIPDELLKLYSQLLHIIVAQSLDFFSSRPLNDRTPILFCLDEFASFGKLELTEALRKLRKRHIRIMVLTQSLADIDLIYGQNERKAMLNNFKFKVILGADDSDTQEYFAKLIGKKVISKSSYTTSSSSSSKTTAESEEWAVNPSQLGHLGNNLIVIHPGGFYFLRKNYYFSKNKHLNWRSKR